MIRTDQDHVGRRREPLAIAALGLAAAPIVLAALLAVAIGGEFYLLALFAVPVSLLAGVGLGVAALVRGIRNGTGGRAAAIAAIVLGGSWAFYVYVFWVNPL